MNGRWRMAVAAMVLMLAWTAIGAGPFLGPTNPAPQVQLAWTASTDQTVTNYFIYYGVASGQYTNKTAVGNVTNATLPLPARGVTYFFAATAYSGSGLESAFSTEVNWTPATPPGAPGMKSPVTLAVQTRPAVNNGQWADAGMNWSLSPDAPSALFRLQVVTAGPAPMVAAGALTRRVRVVPAELPPVPGN